jgi:hypothetical protein
MHETKEDVDLYDQLLSVSEKALARGHFKTAYHTLAAALHVAQDMRDSTRLETISQAAKEQLDHINKHAPESVMSSETAATRAHGVDMLYTLAHVASVRAQMYRSKMASQ